MHSVLFAYSDIRFTTSYLLIVLHHCNPGSVSFRKVVLPPPIDRYCSDQRYKHTIEILKYQYVNRKYFQIPVNGILFPIQNYKMKIFLFENRLHFRDCVIRFYPGAGVDMSLPGKF